MESEVAGDDDLQCHSIVVDFAVLDQHLLAAVAVAVRSFRQHLVQHCPPEAVAAVGQTSCLNGHLMDRLSHVFDTRDKGVGDVR